MQHRQSRNQFNEVLEKEGEVFSFLSSGKSYAQYNRDRMSSFFETRSAAKERTKLRKTKEKAGVLKKKSHIGKLNNYSTDDGLVPYLSKLAPGALVVWTSLAKKFNLKKKDGKTVSNPGQVLRAIASKQGVNTARFTSLKSRMGHVRVRRAKRPLQH